MCGLRGHKENIAIGIRAVVRISLGSTREPNLSD